MKGRTHLHWILSATLLVAAACAEDDKRGGIAGVPLAQDHLTVDIQGPLAINLSGDYRWEAIVIGAEEDVEYEWLIYEVGSEEPLFNTVGPVFDLFLEASYPTAYDVRVLVRSGEHSAQATATVAVCPFTREPMDECAVRFVFAEGAALNDE